MNGLAFFDTNILVYAEDTSIPGKQARAASLIVDHRRSDSLVISLQVLQEYFAVATRKLKVDPALAQQKVEALALRHLIRFTEHDVIAAIELHRLTQISFWDAMIVHAARIANAAVLYSEDLAHGSYDRGGSSRESVRIDVERSALYRKRLAEIEMGEILPDAGFDAADEG